MVGELLAGVFGVLLLIKLYLVHTARKCHNKICLDGKTIIVTGANTGIGFEAAEEFAKRGAKVILACRNKQKAEEATQKIIKNTANESVTYKLLDLSSLESVKNFAQEILETEDKIDILVNNAGAGVLKKKKTKDGLEILMQINYFSPFLLTALLLDHLKKAPSARIINVSSILAKNGRLDVKNLDKFYGMLQTYSNSKLCNILFTKYLAQHILKGTNVSVFSLHPGVINTEVFRRFRGIWKKIFDFIASLYFKSREEGAQTTIYTATQSGLEKYTGRHFVECQVADDYDSAKDIKLAEEVWRKTCDILQLDYSF